jgi:hypothetical protein
VELEKAAVEKSSRLNLANPAWANALKLIELTGADMDSDTIRRINASFLGDQAALRALRDVYKSAGFAYDGGIDQQIYNPETRFEHLRNANHSTFVRGGALNSLANEISQVAAMEGIDFPQVIDEDGMRQAMWKGAGLPVV